MLSERMNLRRIVSIISLIAIILGLIANLCNIITFVREEILNVILPPPLQGPLRVILKRRWTSEPIAEALVKLYDKNGIMIENGTTNSLGEWDSKRSITEGFYILWVRFKDTIFELSINIAKSDYNAHYGMFIKEVIIKPLPSPENIKMTLLIDDNKIKFREVYNIVVHKEFELGIYVRNLEDFTGINNFFSRLKNVYYRTVLLVKAPYPLQIKGGSVKIVNIKPDEYYTPLKDDELDKKSREVPLLVRVIVMEAVEFKEELITLRVRLIANFDIEHYRKKWYFNDEAKVLGDYIIYLRLIAKSEK